MATNHRLKSLLNNFAAEIKSYFKILLGILISILALFVVIVGIVFFLIKDSCENKIVKTIFSPDRKYKVVVFERNCGATTNFSTQISLLSSKKKLPQKEGNLFVGESNGAPINNLGVFHVKVEWLNEDRILIQYPKNIEIFKQNMKKNGKTIEYEVLQSLAQEY